MAMRRAVLFPEQKDFTMLAPWIPSTPAKTVLGERQHATAAGGQGYYSAGMNWLEPVVGLSPGTACGSRVAPEAACHVGSSLSTGLTGRALDLNSYDAVMASQGGVPAPTLYPQAPAMVGATQGWHQVRYGDLVAMAANADAPRRFRASSPVFFSEDVRDDRQQPDTPRRFRASSPVFLIEDVRDDRQQPDPPRRFRATSPGFFSEDVRDDRQQPDPPRRFRATSPGFFSEDVRDGRQQPDPPRRFRASSPVFLIEDVRDDRQQPHAPRRFRASSPVFFSEDVRDDRQQPDPPRRFRATSPGFFSEDGRDDHQQPDPPRRFRATSPVFFSEDGRDEQPDPPRRFRATSPVFFSEDVRDDRQQPSTPFLLNGRIALNTELLNSVQSFSSSCEAVAPLFAPVTPDKKKGTQDGQHLGSAGSVDGGETAKEGQGQVNVPLTFDPKAKGQLVQLHFDQGVLEQTCLSTAGLATQLQENETQEKAELGVDLNQTPAQKPRRKKHRPKVVVEGKPKRTPKPATPKPAGDGEGTPGKGKYVQRKGLNTPLETSPSVLGGEPTKVHVKRTRSAKRHLDFSDEVDKVTCQVTTNAEQAQGESIPETNIGQGTGNSAGNGTSSTNAVTEGQKVDVNYSSGGIALALNHSNNQVLDSYLKSLDTPFYRLQPSRRELIRENLKKLARLRDSRQVPNHESAIRSEIQAGCLSAPENSSTSASASNMSSRDDNMGRNETESNLLTDDDARLHKVNVVPTEFNLAQTCDYNKVNGISKYSRDRNNHLPCFPETPKKRRTQKVKNGLAFNQVASFADAQRILEFERLHAMESRQAPSAQTEVKTRKRSKVPSQCSKLASLTDMKSGQLPADTQNTQVHNERQENGITHEPQDCLEALAADNLAKVRRKRRTKKGQIQDFSTSLEPCNTSNCCGAAVPYVQGNDHLLDVIVHRMKCLNINRDHEENKDQEQSAIVPYGGHGMLIPFEGQFDPRKKSRPRAKVDLDQETNRAWNLLMGKENYDGIEGTDIDKEKWWEGERQVFHGRADSFISRMHLVQGDRRFSPWKGSVLDSVIGVFLTQNVSDHLSSSAFMALAARFPRQLRGKDKETNCNKGTTSTVQSVVCTIDLNMTENGSNQQALDHVHMVVHEAKQKGEKEMHSAGGGIEGDTFPYLNTFNVPLREIRSLTESDDRRPLDDTHSSENSSDDPVLTAEQFGSISESKSEAVDMLPATVCNLESRASFVELLEIARTCGFQEFCSRRSGRSCETESFNKAYTSILQHGWPLGEGRSSFSPVIPIEFKNLDNRARTSAENATEKSAMASQSVSSGDSHEFIVNLATQSLSGSSTNTGYGKHLCDNYMFTRVTTEALATNNYHNDFGLLEERTTEIQRKERSSCIFVKNIMNGFEALSETEKSIAQQVYSSPVYLREKSVVAECFGEVDKGKYVSDKAVKENSKEEVFSSLKNPTGEASSAHGTRRGKSEKNKNFDWESLRRQICQNGAKKERSSDTMDSLDWDAVRNADVNEISNTIRERGMNNMLAERIKSFLDRLVKEHGSIDLEWLRDIPPDKAKDYLLSIRGLGLKSVECVRLLTLHHLAFPVDTNVGRICVRLGWVPLQPLPESLQLHLLELYPVLETIQKYLWPRLCTLDQRTLYELHYQMITFGKVFCTKSKPNCNACPMRGECKHFASAFASARLALPGPEEKILVTTSMEQNHKTVTNPWLLPRLEGYSLMQEVRVVSNCEPIIEEPATPEPDCTQIPDIPDIEDAFCEDPDEIPTIQLNAKEFAQNLQSYMQQNNMELQNVDWSKALVTLTPDAASIPMPKLKNVSRLRTEHQVYELPDSHPLLEGLDQREPQDPCPYLLAIWTPGETAQSTEPPESCFDAQGEGSLCDKQTCFSCSSIREAQAQMVRGTLLIPCRTAMRGSFPLNGTYFQVNEVFADHDSSLTPIDVPRALIWNLPRRTVYFGTSVPTIFRGLAIEDIQNCFWRGFVCVRGFDRKSRGPRPLMARLHFPASKAPRGKKAATKDGEQTMQETRK